MHAAADARTRRGRHTLPFMSKVFLFVPALEAVYLAYLAHPERPFPSPRVLVSKWLARQKAACSCPMLVHDIFSRSLSHATCSPWRAHLCRLRTLKMVTS